MEYTAWRRHICDILFGPRIKEFDDTVVEVIIVNQLHVVKDPPAWDERCRAEGGARRGGARCLLHVTRYDAHTISLNFRDVDRGRCTNEKKPVYTRRFGSLQMLLASEFKNPKVYMHVKILGNILYFLPIHLNSSSSEEKLLKER
ncbi:PREDICTED: uncharacterized protein LOC108746728 [Trachymyrmex septentrionalis]|uniref:uncharacterized protein LOC108746728 n=1 Tax=Trachymyrmex septentrionalis TaxID=34720 RepID=UPI00084EF4B1|nr:PREDICTED: uncharacterized protein LOC108746728 [Trachymyrmex septentrionalis]